MSILEKFNSFIQKENGKPPFPGTVLDPNTHRWTSQYKEPEEKSNLSYHNTQKTCNKCGFNKKLVAGSQKDKDLTECPNCKNKNLKRSSFSPNF